MTSARWLLVAALTIGVSACGSDEALTQVEEPAEVRAFVAFHDRMTGADPVSAADSAAIAAVDGRFRYIYDLVRYVAVELPATGVEPLRADAAVESVEVIETVVRPTN